MLVSSSSSGSTSNNYFASPTTDPSLYKSASSPPPSSFNSNNSLTLAPIKGEENTDNKESSNSNTDFSPLQTLTMAAAAADKHNVYYNNYSTNSNNTNNITNHNNNNVSSSASPSMSASDLVIPENQHHLIQSSPMSIASLTNPINSTNASMQVAYHNATGHHNHNNGGVRKKKQCDTCQGWFSNLATHRSIHLADNSRPHTCEVCGRGFARPNDLFRHQKSHRGDAPFRCPLFIKNNSNQHANGNRVILEPVCHQNGGFSRCDTYKNHLKAMHFEYPPGTKKRDRGGVHGKCKGCGLSFQSSDEWINLHIETGDCEGIKRVQQLNSSI